MLRNFLKSTLLLGTILLGLINPASLIDAILHFVIFCYVLVYISSKHRIAKFYQLILFISVIIIYSSKNSSLLLFLFVGLINWFIGNRIIRLKKEMLIPIPIIIIFLLTSFFNSTDVRQYLVIEPIRETYRSDLDDFLRTFYLMKQGKEYYSSFSQSVSDNAFKGYVAPNVWSWRFPTLFYFWKILPGGNGLTIYYSFIVLGTLLLYISYSLISLLLKPSQKYLAILSPYFLYPYLHFAARDKTVLNTEWWAVGVYLIGLYFFIKNRNLSAIFFFILTVVTRELLAIPLLLTGLLAVWTNKKNWYVFFIPLIFLLLMVFFHIQSTKLQFVYQSNSYLSLRTHTFDKQIILTTFAYGAWEYFFYFWRIFIVFYMLGVFGVIRFTSSFILFLPFFLFPLTFFIIGSSAYNDYWGIMFIPFVLISLPLVLATKSLAKDKNNNGS